MKKFQFSLKALLSYREHLERMAKQELAEVIAEINRVDGYLDELKEYEERARSDFEARSEEGISAGEITMFMDYLSGVEQRKLEARNYRKRLTQLEDKKRVALARKSVEKKVIVNLKERRKKEYVEETEKLLQQQSDEMVLLAGPSMQGDGDFVNRDKE